MCLFRSFTTKEAYGLTIFQGIYSPRTIYCKECKLHPDKPDQGNWHVNIDYSDQNINKWKGQTVYGIDEEAATTAFFDTVLSHIDEHIKAGHYVHPGVKDLMQECMDAELWRIRWEYQVKINKSYGY